MYVAISNGYFDAHGNQGAAANATFTVDATGPAAPTFAPADGDTAGPGTDITLTFAEALRKDAAGAELANADLAAILTLKTTDASGTDIAFGATIDAAKKVITLDPTSDLAAGDVYVAISNGYFDAHGNQGAAANATFTVDATGPAAPTFAPADGDTAGPGTDITLTFAEALRKDAAGAELANADLAAILTLKTTDASGTDIAFGATIDAAKKVITLDPTSDLAAGDVYVAISNGYFDAHGNQGAAANATFTVDATGPAAPTFAPADGDTAGPGTDITLTFAEALRKDAAGAELANTDLAAILTLKTTDASGTDIAFGASIDAAKKVITLDPTSDLAAGDVYVAISNGYFDAHGNQGAAANATFTVDATGPAAPTFAPADGDTAGPGTDITLTFAEALRKDAAGAELANTDLAAILTLKTTDASGTDIAFGATIDAAKKVITLDPTSDLAAGDVYVAISNGYFDAHGNQGAAANATFTVDATGPAAPTFAPADGDTAGPGTDITLTFAEALRKDAAGAELANTDLAAILTLKTTDASGTDIAFGATIDAAKKVITLDPTSDLAAGDVYVAISNGYFDAHGNQGAAANATFTVDATGPAAPTFAPADGDTAGPGTDITLTFAEALEGRRRHRARQRRPRRASDAEDHRRERHGHRLHRPRRGEEGHLDPTSTNARQPGCGGQRHLHGGRHRSGGADVRPGRRRHRRPGHGHHADLRRGAEEGRRRRRARERRPRRDSDPEDHRRERHGHRLRARASTRRRRSSPSTRRRTWPRATCTWRSRTATSTRTATRARRPTPPSRWTPPVRRRRRSPRPTATPPARARTSR